MLNFFKSFPLIQYQIDNESADTSIIVDITRNIKVYLNELDNANAYLYKEINDGSRPDQLSMELYQTPSYWWTFFVINDSLSTGLHAWPKSALELENYIDEKYPHVVFTPELRTGRTGTQHWIHNYNLLIGEEVLGLVSGARGVVVEIQPELNSVVIRKTNTIPFQNENTAFLTSTFAFPANINYRNIFTPQKDAVHHYVNAAGTSVERLIFSQTDPQLPVTNYEYETEVNDRKTQLRVLNKSVVDEFATRFRSLINK